MTTALYELVDSIPIRLRELNVLLAHAKDMSEKIDELQSRGEKFESEEELYNVICRSCCVLMASHVEAYVKDLTSSVLSDMNFHLKNFALMPSVMQRTFCEKIAYYDGVPDNEIQSRVTSLVKFFAKNSVNIDMSAFSYKENPNKNPNHTVVDKAFRKFGVDNIVSSLDIPALTAIFTSDVRVRYLLDRDLVRFKSSLYKFPYSKIKAKYSFKRIAGKAVPPTLWHTFLEDVMNRRHSIAHGEELNNPTAWNELEEDLKKLNVMMYALAYSAADALR